MTVRSRVRRARVPHVACGGHCPQIQPGDLYIEHTWFPGGDSEYANSAARPVRMTECRKCADRYGRGALITVREASDKAAEWRRRWGFPAHKGGGDCE